MSVQPLDSVDQKVAMLLENLDLNSSELHDEEFPFELYRALRRDQPVTKIESPGLFPWTGPVWFVARYKDVQGVFQDDVNYSSRHITAGGIPGPFPTGVEPQSLDDVDPFIVASHSQKIPLGLDPPQFSVYRPLLNPLFSPGAARKTQWASREIAARLIDDIIGKESAELHHELAKAMPAMLICRLLGLAEEEWERFAITTPDTGAYAAAESDSRESVINRVIPSMDAQMTMLQLADAARRDPRDDIITAVAHLTVGGRLLNYYELGAILSVLLSGGVHTTTLAMEAGLAYLGRNPDEQQRLREHPELVPAFTEEVLRMWPPLHGFPRSVNNDVIIGGQQIKAGDWLNLSIASANRDEGEFEDPDTFKMDRHPNRHVTFAVGIHRCLGSSLARQELLVSFEEVMKRLPMFTIDESRTDIRPNSGSIHEPDRRLTALFQA